MSVLARPRRAASPTATHDAATSRTHAQTRLGLVFAGLALFLYRPLFRSE